MKILELKQMIEVDTPKGHGRVWLVTDYGTEIEKIFTIIMDNGEIWEFRNNEIKISSNLTMGRGKF